MAVAPTPENFRAAMAYYTLSRDDVCSRIDMNPRMFSQLVHGSKPLMGWAAHNIGVGINLAVGKRLIDVDMDRGILPSPPRGRPSRWNKPDEIEPTRRPITGANVQKAG